MKSGKIINFPKVCRDQAGITFGKLAESYFFKSFFCFKNCCAEYLLN